MEQVQIDRRRLLPWWIKFFCWLFMFTTVLTFIRAILLFFGINSAFEIYGFNANDNYPINSILIFVVYLLHGVTAYSLWFGKKNAIEIGIVNAVFGLILCVLSMILAYLNSKMTGRLEIFLLVLFLYKLIELKPKWRSMIEKK